jgi:CheY-like chemotaxis protein
VLVVDDEKGIRDALVQLFEYEGHDVSAAEDGHNGIELAEKLRPDVTFLDVKMPGLDGLDVLAKLREQDPQAVVVMISPSCLLQHPRTPAR